MFSFTQRKAARMKQLETAGEKAVVVQQLIPAGLNLGDALKDDRNKEKKFDEKIMCFHGNINRKLADSRLKKGGHKSGYFLVRQNMFFPGDFSLSLMHEGKPVHFHISQTSQGLYTVDKGPTLNGLDDVIEFYSADAQGLPTRLTTPCKDQPPPRLSRNTGYTNLLLRAIAAGDTELTKSILDHKHCPDIDAKNEQGSTVLHIASEIGELEIVERVLKKKPCVSMYDSKGYTALQLAVQTNSVDVIKKLVLVGHADTQDRHRDTGRTALHDAAEAGFLECVRVLLGLGAPAWPLDYQGVPPHTLALNQGHVECAKLLDDYEGPPAQTNRSEWLHENLDTEKASILLQKKQQDGTFLVRESHSKKGFYVLCLLNDLKVYNIRIKNVDEEGTVYQIGNGPLLPSLEHLIEFYCWRKESLPCILTHALGKDGELVRISVRHVINFSMINDEAQGHKENPEGDYVEYANFDGNKSFMRSKEKPTMPVKRQPRRNYSIRWPLQLNQKNIELTYEIGQGEFGSVYKGTWTNMDTGEKVDVAIKTLHEHSTGAAKDQFLQEAKVMVKLSHQYIVKLIGVCEGPPIMLVQELASMGSMLDFLLDYPEKINVETDLYLWAAQIACGMNYLESKCFVHRDLAARNILLASKRDAKVGDFGLSRATGRDSHYQASQGGKWPLRWYAPEAFLYGTFSSSSDVWSYGVTLWEMFSFGEQPYEDMTGAQVTEYIRQGQRLKKPPKCPELVFSQMKQCWAFEPKDRPTFKSLHQHFNQDPMYASVRELVLSSEA